MKSVIDWVVAQRYRPILLAMAFSALVPVLATALLGLVAVRRGAAQASISAAGGIAAVALIEVVTSGKVGMLTAFAAGTMIAGVALGALVAWARGLSLSFQATLLFCVVVAVAITLFGPTPHQIFAAVTDWLVNTLQKNGATEAQLQAARSLDSLLLGLGFAVVFTGLVVGLLLIYWWVSLVRTDLAFGREFRLLRMGHVLGIPALIVVSVGLVLNTPVVQNLTLLALFAFLFQGLAVMHAWAHAKRWHPVLLGLVYLLFVTPLSLAAILGLSVVGLLDNVFELRSPLRAQA